jgi:hypothetical protein
MRAQLNGELFAHPGTGVFLRAMRAPVFSGQKRQNNEGIDGKKHDQNKHEQRKFSD